jgi:hypothetical protein
MTKNTKMPTHDGGKGINHDWFSNMAPSLQTTTMLELWQDSV